MTIDERIASLTLTLKPWMPLIDDRLAQRHLKDALLEVARDQRQACADAVDAVHLDERGHLIDINVARHAALNAELPK